MPRSLLTILVCFTAAICAAQSTGIKTVSAKEVRAMIDSSHGPMIFNFWASYCSPCIREIPYFETTVEQSAKPVKLVLVSLDMPRFYPVKFRDFLKRTAFKSESLLLKETEYDYFIIDKKWSGGIPTSIFVDNSKNYYQLFKLPLTQQMLAKEIDKMLNYVALPLSSQ
jgi:thiol-disulfide isomerase/thioredoxin